MLTSLNAGNIKNCINYDMLLNIIENKGNYNPSQWLFAVFTKVSRI